MDYFIDQFIEEKFLYLDVEVFTLDDPEDQSYVPSEEESVGLSSENEIANEAYEKRECDDKKPIVDDVPNEAVKKVHATPSMLDEID